MGLKLPPKPKRVRNGSTRSRWEAQLERDLVLLGLPSPNREHPVVSGRRWRFDLAWPVRRIAVEVQGGTRWGRSRHSKGEGYENDCRKLLAAQMDGWIVIYVTSRMVKSGEAQELVKEAFEARRPGA